ncbi:MAG: hypothetical protein LUC38_07855 [Oscillospiraceae bacterium]|nr:hypothetical protein [Oscillospiraceae bacterium]
MVDRFSIMILFIALYPILPTYFVVGNISGVFILVALFFILYLFTTHGKLTLKRPSNWTDIFMALFVVSTFVSGIVNEKWVSNIYYIAYVPVLGILIINEVDSEEKFNRVIEVLVSVAGLLSIFAVIETITGYNVFFY